MADVCKSIETLFNENKESTTMDLDDELRNLSIRDFTVMAYYTKIKEITDLLSNIVPSVS